MGGPKTPDGKARALANLRPIKLTSLTAKAARARVQNMPRGEDWWASEKRVAAFKKMRKAWTPGCQVRGRHKIPQHAHPLVRRVFELLREEHATIRELAKRAGLDPSCIEGWRKSTPNLVNIEAALGAFGYRLAAVPDKESKFLVGG